jgi:hypothetical protein
MPTYDISEGVPYDISIPSTEASFELTDTAYDVVIDDLPFVINVSNQNPYRRETAQYRKDQFDNSAEPGEQSLTGWWLRSQTSWHNGAGISFYEPGTDYQHVSHRFADSRGVDVWTIGEARLLPEVVDVYTGGNLINAAVGSDGVDVLISGDSAGVLRKITFDADNSATVAPYTIASHSSYAFSSVTTDGTNYYATCDRAIHTGPIGSDSDVLAFKYSNADVAGTFIKYVKGYVLFGFRQSIYNMNSIPTTGFVPSGSGRTTSSHSHTSGTDTLPPGFKTHINPNWVWNDATAGPNAIYMSGNAGSNGEVWQVLFDEATNSIDMAGATMVVSLPDGENVNSIHYYLGVLAVGTNKGLRICPINGNGQVAIGPLLYENGYYPVNGFTEEGNYIYAATKTDNENGTKTHACLIRVDLSAQFDDGTYAFAHDLEYRSSVNEAYTISNKALTSNVATLTTNVDHDFNVDNTVTVSGVDSWLISNKALTSNIATLTTSTVHGFTAGNSVTIVGVDSTFNGTYNIISVPTTTTFTYAKTAGNVSSTAVTPVNTTYAVSLSSNSIFNGTYTVTAVTSNTFSYAKTNANISSVAVSPNGSVSETASDSEATEVYSVNGRLVMVVEEDETTDSGELHIESETLKRDTGWFTTGKIRYGTVEPKFFRYINVQCTTGQGDNITVYTIDKSGQETSLAILSQGISNQDVFIATPSTKQEYMSFKFVFNNVTDDQSLPVLEAYQIKAVPATRRQRIYQYPLSCYDSEMDKFSSIFGYTGRAMEYIQRMEAIEETGKFVNVIDYRTGEQYEGVIEEVRFTNESSPDKNSSGFGGLLLVTVRKM